MTKQWDNKSRAKFNESRERFNKAISQCDTKGRVILVDFKTKEACLIINKGEKLDKKAA